MKYLGDYIPEEKKAQIRALESAALGTVDGSAERELIYLKIKVLLLEAQGEQPEEPALAGFDHHHGLTKREAFAMAAMQGMCANSGPLVTAWPGPINPDFMEFIARQAVLQADFLLAELTKLTKEPKP